MHSPVAKSERLIEIGCNFVREEGWPRMLSCQRLRKPRDKRLVPIFARRPVFPKNIENASHGRLGGSVPRLHCVHQGIGASIPFKVVLDVEPAPRIQLHGITEMQCHGDDIGLDISPSGVAHLSSLQCPEMRLRKLGPEVPIE